MSLNELKSELQIRSMIILDIYLNVLFFVSSLYLPHLYDFYFPVVNWFGKRLGDLRNLNDCFYTLNYQFLCVRQFICNVLKQISLPVTHQLKLWYVFLDRPAQAVGDHKPLVDNTSNQVVFEVCPTIQQKRYLVHPVLTHFRSQAEIRLIII